MLLGWEDAHSRCRGNRFILVGATRDGNGHVTYGGYELEFSTLALRFREVWPSKQLTKIDAFNGNFVVVPRIVTAEIGLNDPAFFHNMGDIDYGLRARKVGIASWLLPGTVGECESNVAKTKRGFGSPDLTMREQWQVVNTHRGLPFQSWGRLTFRHSGMWAPFHFLMPYRHLFMPRKLRVLATVFCGFFGTRKK
jgi:GT2 family glycosyltransferase